jgi:ATP-binding cassette subfamily B protein/ATP-binding cassette subfamily C protein CydC
VLDEPGNHLTTVDLAEILGAIRRALPQATIVTVGHDDTCARIADRALMLNDGALTDCMSVEGLSDEWGREG